jgi:hypothetical protein
MGGPVAMWGGELRCSRWASRSCKGQAPLESTIGAWSQGYVCDPGWSGRWR